MRSNLPNLTNNPKNENENNQISISGKRKNTQKKKKLTKKEEEYIFKNLLI
jgi:hypothetical protein